jgi:hypothetical protein
LARAVEKLKTTTEANTPNKSFFMVSALPLFSCDDRRLLNILSL